MRKDKTTGLGAVFQHRHFAGIATIISELSDLTPSDHYYVRNIFAKRLKETNPNFDVDRFIEACDR